MSSILKLIPLAIIAAVAVVLLGRSGPAAATPSSLTIDGSTAAVTVANLGTATVLATHTDEGTNLTLYSTASTSVGYFLGGSSITQNSDSQTLTPNASQATSITVTDDIDTLVETTALQASFLCVGSGSTSIYFSQGGGSSAQIAITCGSSATTLSASPTSVAIGAGSTITGNCTAATQPLTASSTGGYFSGSVTNGTYISSTQVNCNAAGAIIATFYCSSAATVTLTLNGVVAYVYCGSSSSTLSASPASASIGATSTITGNCTAASQALTASFGGYFSGTITNGSYVSSTQVNCNAAGSIVATFYCASTATTTFSLNGVTATLYCGSAGSSLTVSPTSATVGAAATVTGSCGSAGQLLNASGYGNFTSSATNATYVSATQLNCTAAGTLYATYYCSAAGTVSFSLNGATAYLYCTGSSPYVQPTAVAPLVVATTSPSSGPAPAASGNLTTISSAPVLPPSISPPNTGDAGLFGGGGRAPSP